MNLTRASCVSSQHIRLLTDPCTAPYSWCSYCNVTWERTQLRGERISHRWHLTRPGLQCSCLSPQGGLAAPPPRALPWPWRKKGCDVLPPTSPVPGAVLASSCSQKSMTCKWGSCCKGFKCRSENYKVISIDKGKPAAASFLSLPFKSCPGISQQESEKEN